MANWCNNIVVFTGDQHILDSLQQLFQVMADKGQAQGKGQLPLFVTEDGGYFFNIAWEAEVLYYETRRTPNTDIVRHIADVFGAAFIHSYSETGNGIYGEAVYEQGILTNTYLEPEDLEAYTYDDTDNTYLFENEVYESSYEVLEILLERKKAIQSLAS